jgi:hypothetical protein
VAFSSDGVPYVSHGGDLTRRAGQPMGFIEEYASDELDRLVLVDGSALLRFEDFQKRYGGRFDRILLDVKTWHAGSASKARTLSGLIPAEDAKRFEVISLSGVFLLRFKDERPEIPAGCESYLAVGNRLAGFDMLSCSFLRVNAARDRTARRMGLKRLYWTAWSREDIARILSWRPDGLIVDLGGENPPPVPDAWRKSGEEP